jgi:cellulose synthase/poly-beta-1,6-N-acetylglucosamine synthase-like glycosyltransferase
MDLLREGPEAPDAVVVVDADSVAEPGLLAALAARAEAGADVVQAEYLALAEDESPASMLRAAALLLFHRVRFSGRAALGMPCNLVGNGMLFSRRLLSERPWGAFTSAEDLEYSIDLRLAGFRPVYASEGCVRGPMPAGGRGARTQRLRWEGGRFHVVRTRLPKLLRAILAEGRRELADAAVDLAVPPLGLLVTGAMAGTATSGVLVAAGVVPAWVLLPWLAASLLPPAFVVVGLRAGRAPAAMYRSLVLAPRFLAAALAARLRLVRSLRATTWERTERPGERVTVSGRSADA